MLGPIGVAYQNVSQHTFLSECSPTKPRQSQHHLSLDKITFGIEVKAKDKSWVIKRTYEQFWHEALQAAKNENKPILKFMADFYQIFTMAKPV